MASISHVRVVQARMRVRVVRKTKRAHVVQVRRQVFAVQKRFRQLLRNKTMVDIEGYHKAVAYIESFSNTSLRKNLVGVKKSPQFFLDRTKYFLKLLGNPEKGFSYIHVTGTAGKGSVTSMLRSVLTASGKKTGLFTSPYVTTTVEKMQVDDHYMSVPDFITTVEYLKPYIAEAEKGPFGGVSPFEISFAIALLYFKQEKCDWVVLEVGLGGRYDSTNAITSPVVTAITNIDYDHTEILGKTLREIAFDKAGIIKKGSLFFTSEQRPSLQNFFKKVCREVGAEFSAIKRQKHYSLYNKELVSAIARAIHISDADIDMGLTDVRMPCRFEIVDQEPTVILDGAHNRAKIRSTISNLRSLSFKKLFLIVAIADNKNDNRAILQYLVTLPYPTHIIITQVRIGERRTISPELLLSIAKEYKKNSKSSNKVSFEIVEDHRQVVERALSLAHKDDLILSTGSFFLSGELRKQWISEAWVLEHQRSFKK